MEWDKIFSKPEKDVAIFRIKDIQIKPLEYMKESPAGSDVRIFGYSTNSLKNFPKGLPVESKIYTETIPFHSENKDIKGQKPWNKKPEVCLKVYRLEGKYEQGFSGAPVFYKVNNKVVGMFTALEQGYGYIIPIEELCYYSLQ